MHKGPPFKYTLKMLQEFAATKGGKCLSPEYLGFHEKHEWQCANGHTWFAKWYKIKINGQWCPYCCKQRYMNEEKCRFILEFFTDKKFAPNRTILKNGLELDGYCDDLRLAFEFNGKQHYEKHKYFHRNGQSLEKRQGKDREKAQKCKELSIELIVIPYWICEKNEEVSFIHKKLEENKINIINKPDNFSYENFWKSTSKIEELREFARKKGGKLISTVYLGNRMKMEWECAKGHRFYAIWANVGWLDRWCPECSVWGAKTGPTRRKTMDECREAAAKKNLKILSTEYQNERIKMDLECVKCSKQITTTMSRVKRRKTPFCC